MLNTTFPRAPGFVLPLVITGGVLYAAWHWLAPVLPRLRLMARRPVDPRNGPVEKLAWLVERETSVGDWLSRRIRGQRLTTSEDTHLRRVIGDKLKELRAQAAMVLDPRDGDQINHDMDFQEVLGSFPWINLRLCDLDGLERKTLIRVTKPHSGDLEFIDAVYGTLATGEQRLLNYITFGMWGAAPAPHAW